MRYPTDREGLPISPYLLQLPSGLDLREHGNWNNHHALWPVSVYTGNLILNTLRSLSALQFEMPIDSHDDIHQGFLPPKRPRLAQAMGRLELAYLDHEPLKHGSIGHPIYTGIDDRMWDRLQETYAELRHE